MKHLTDIVKRVIAALITAVLLTAIPTLDLGRILPFLKGWDITLKINVGGLILTVCALSSVLLYLFISRRPLAVKNGRVGAMASNVRLLKKWTPRSRLKKYILSTRVSFWPPTEDESVRNEFRRLLTSKIREGYRVQRIWQIHNQDDLKKLLAYLEIYKQYDNYSVKCFVGESAFIPEILSVGGRYLSVSIPQAEDPRRLTTAFHFRGRFEILRWEAYFHILWEQSIPVKIGGNIYEENVERLRVQLAANRR